MELNQLVENRMVQCVRKTEIITLRDELPVFDDALSVFDDELLVFVEWPERGDGPVFDEFDGPVFDEWLEEGEVHVFDVFDHKPMENMIENVSKNENSVTFKDLFAKDKNVDMNPKESLDCSDEISEITGIDENTIMGGNSDKKDEVEVVLAEEKHISIACEAELSTKVEEMSNSFELVGGKMECTTYCPDFNWEIQGHNFAADVRILQLGGCDMVFGVDLLRKWGPVLFDFDKQRVTLVIGGSKVTLQGQQQETTLKLLTAPEMEEEVEGKADLQGVLFWISELNPTEMETAVAEQLHPVLEQHRSHDPGIVLKSRELLLPPPEPPPHQFHDLFLAKMTQDREKLLADEHGHKRELAEELGAVISNPWVSWFKAASLSAFVSLLATPSHLVQALSSWNQRHTRCPCNGCQEIRSYGPPGRIIIFCAALSPF